MCGKMRRSALCADRVRDKELCHAYNQLRPSDAAGMRELLRRLLGKTGETFCVTTPFWCDYGYNIRLGEHFYANHNLVILDCAAVTFGEHVFVAPNCGLYTAGHPIDAVRRERGRQRRRQRHSERFGRCRQSVQGHSADHGGGQTDLLGQIARGCMARGTQDANQNAEARQNEKRKAV